MRRGRSAGTSAGAEHVVGGAYAPFPDGLYVIGDSISFAVPYVETGACG